MAKDKAVKVEREYKLTDDSVNVYGFRLLTSGFQQEQYMRNPIGYRMHERDKGVVLRWKDFRREEDRVYAKPVINLSNPLGQQTLEEVENNFLNAASVGKIVVLEISDSEELKLPGQEGPTVTKWYPKEISLVDIPGNSNALAPLLYDEEGNEINLSDWRKKDIEEFNNKYKKPIKKVNMAKGLALRIALIQALNLSDNVDDETIQEGIKDLVDKASKVEILQKNLADLKTEKEEAEQNLTDLKNQINQDKIQNLLDAGQKAGKITAKLAKDLADKYADDPEGLASLIEGLPAYRSLSDSIEKAGGASASLIEKSWDELDKSGKLPDLKARDFEAFKEKFKEKFGKDYV